MRSWVKGLTVAVIGGATAAHADDTANEKDPLWQMSSCTNPGLSYAVKRKRLSGEIHALFDISADGDVENIRILEGDFEEGMSDYVTRALNRWSYFGYVKNGELAARKDVPITFTYGPEKKRGCMHTSLPEPPSTLGDPTDPYQSLLQCTELMMPRKAARRKDPGHVRFSYDISADGAVSNLQVLSATPDDRYVEEATDALDSWKYQEFIQTGEAIARPGMVVDFYYGELPEGANSDRCTYAPWDATQQIMRRRMIQ
ncbi:energy transducer TonB [Kordiimonas gwangyangensis]|uniref:energy transducer TonB n=1 Tax=Kordiimonas gwangyangensis TaxID=288022 RepID=UPI000364E1FA|nr:energy transducer TonB [Kordiimonas gwangyangensis]